MALIVNNQNIELSSSFNLITSKDGEINVDVSTLSKYELNNILFIGFPSEVKLVRNINQSELSKLKMKLKSNNAVNILYKVIEELHSYEYFVILTHGIDPEGVALLYKLPEVFDTIRKKIILIETPVVKYCFNFSK